MSDEWYGDVVEYKLTGRIAGEPKDGRGTRRVKLQAARFVLKETEGRAVGGKDGDEGGSSDGGRGVELLYREVSGELARCVREGDVPRILHRYHDCHGYFAGGMIVRTLRGKYYWPTRTKDAVRYSRDCNACQRFGPLKPTAGQKPILSLQPMDMLGMDFLDPIKPMGIGRNRYILIVMDYYSRFLFAEAVPEADGKTVVKVLQKIARMFRWPIAIYCDNASYFIKGRVLEELKAHRVMQFSAPITHPSSVGLSERYVQLVLTGLRTVLAHENQPLDRWDSYLNTVVFAINNQILRIHGFTPSQLFLGMSPRARIEDITIRDETMGTSLAEHQLNGEK